MNEASSLTVGQVEADSPLALAIGFHAVRPIVFRGESPRDQGTYYRDQQLSRAACAILERL